MALTVNVKNRLKLSNRFAVVIDVTFDNSYATGGEALKPGDVGLTSIDFVLPSTASGYMFEYDHANGKLKAIYPRAAVTGTLAASVASGATAVTSSAANGAIVTLTGNPAVAAGNGSEVTAATDLSTVTVRVIVIGY